MMAKRMSGVLQQADVRASLSYQAAEDFSFLHPVSL